MLLLALVVLVSPVVFVAELCGRVSAFIRRLVAHRRSVGIAAWRSGLRGGSSGSSL